MANTNGGGVQTTRKTFAIVHALKELDGARIDELSEHLDMASSTVHRHVATLDDLGYLDREGDVYHLGLRFLTLGGHAQTRQPVFDLAKEKVDQIARETDERSQFIVEDGGRRMYVYTEAGTNAVKTDATIGKRGPIHSSAAGKAILAASSDEFVADVLDRHGVSQVTPHTIDDRETLLAEIEEIRERGYAFNEQESTLGLRAVASTITGVNGEVYGAISIAGPAHRFKGELFRSEYPDLLLAATNEIELKLEYS
ncbi:IclR family transcriptional regulator [Halopenitus persicus]|uniref:Transcriptional regulator, IclR family n=1 Tax=Halopenitus persicus TaxID=1048396 RepID=A0A1H3H626_9EURY|nr:IclR family transcriptional regulator [Halopenitus persicus]SDY11023.1 transcriptional regulator, IclR family [Halopenitus persicus]